MNMSDVDGLPVPSSSLTLTQPCAKSWHYFHTCWEDITSAPHMATIYLSIFTGSVFSAQNN